MATSIEHVSTGSASSYLVTYSTAMIIHLAPDHLAGIGNGPMNSMAQISNVRLGFTDIKGISVLGRGRPSHWHLSHRLTKLFQSLWSVNHHNPDCWIFFAVVSA